MAKLSTQITGKIRSGLFLLSALSQQGPRVAELLLMRARTSLPEDEEPVDFLAQIRGLGQILQATLNRMVEADRALYRENAKRAQRLSERDDQVTTLGKRVRGVRRILTGAYDAPDIARLGLEGRTPREPVALLRRAELLLEGLRREDLDQLLKEPLFLPPLDPRPYVPQIELLAETLRLAYEAHQASRRRVDELLAEKKTAVAAYHTAFLRVARQFEDLCRLAGLQELAEKVRPSLTRRGETQVRPEKDAGVDAPEVDAEDAGSPGTGSDPAAEDRAARDPLDNDGRIASIRRLRPLGR
ncbi:MAG: hypothetical protein AAF657_27130 [Acidobacteriota bacterium]